MGASKLSDFQTKKVERVFSTFFDINNDGIIEWEDFEIAVEKIRTMHAWDAGSAPHKKAMDTMRLIWEGLKSYADQDKDDKITRQEWCQMWSDFNESFKKKAEVPAWQKQYMDFMFDVNDTSGDGSIDKEEYTAVYTGYGLTTDDCSKAFDKFAPTEGVDRATYAQLWNEYFTSADPAAKGNFIFGTF